MTLEERIYRLERIMVLVTRDIVNQRSAAAETEMYRLVNELRAEHTVRSGADLVLTPE